MPIIVNLDVVLARRKIRSKELAERIGITEQNVSLLKSGKVKGVRFETLEKICEVLQCQPGDILEYRAERDQRGVEGFRMSTAREGKLVGVCWWRSGNFEQRPKFVKNNPMQSRKSVSPGDFALA